MVEITLAVVVAIFLPFAAAALTVYIGPLLKGRIGWWAVAVALVPFALMASFLPSVSQGARFSMSAAWVPELGVNLSFLVDGVSLLFALIVAGIGALILAYSHYYLKPEENRVRFYALMLLFMGSMLGIVLSANLLVLFVFWELTSLTSYFLIAFWPERVECGRAATQALLVTVLGGLAMLGGFILLYLVAGTFELTQLWESREAIQASPLYVPILVLVLVGAFSKSGQFPLHFWLPNAMVAPTPVSAYLHSAAMVKAGIFLIARFYPLLAGTPEWFYLVGGVGLITMLWGGYQAIRQMELKALLAYSTISQLGMITASYGLGTELGVVAATFLIVNHAVFKAALFMIVGIVDHAASARHFHFLGGLAGKMPLTTGLAVVAALALAGVPPLNGFLSKELFFAATGELAGATASLWFLPLVAGLGAVFTVIYALKFVLGAFFGPAVERNFDVHDASVPFLAAPALLALVCLFVGIVPAVISGPVLVPAAATILRNPVELDIRLWHGVNQPLLISATGIVLGVVGYWQSRRVIAVQEAAAFAFGAERVYEACLLFLNQGTARIFQRVQSGYLRRYLMIVACIPVALVGVTIWAKAGVSVPPLGLGLVHPYEYAIVLFFLVATIATAVQKDRLGAILALGAVGSLVSLTYMVYSAPDLALTQLLIELLSTVLFALVFVYMLPFAKAHIPKAWLPRDIAIGAAIGIMVTTLMLVITASPIYESIRYYYEQTSATLAGGNNVVNVIIVDYRGYDTMGEITVLSISAIALFALVKFGKGKGA